MSKYKMINYNMSVFDTYNMDNKTSSCEMCAEGYFYINILLGLFCSICFCARCMYPCMKYKRKIDVEINDLESRTVSVSH